MSPCPPTAVTADATETAAPGVSAGGTSAWNQFWFGDTTAAVVLPAVRVAASVLAICYFLSYWSDAGRWFAGDGLLSAPQLSAFLDEADLGEHVRWRLSPLYWVDSPLGLRVFLLVGIGWAVLTLVVWQTRLPAIALWLWVVWWANRALLVAGLEELVLVWMLAYLAIAPPLPPRWWSGGLRRSLATGGHWSGSLAKRLLQIHMAVAMAAMGLGMLSSAAWWDGTGVMAIVSPVEIRSFDWTTILRQPWRHELLTHGVVALAIALPILLWNRACRPAALILGWLWCLGLAALSSQWLYFLCLGVVLTTYFPEKWLLAWNRHATFPPHFNRWCL